MEEALTRKEKDLKNADKLKALGRNMKRALSKLSQGKEGLIVLRYWFHDSGFTRGLTYETPEGVNTDLLLSNEAKRRQYLELRKFMDRETIIRVELPDVVENKGGEDGTRMFE